MIEVKNITKVYNVKEKKGFFADLFTPTYKKIHAVNSISFTIKAGEMVGFIGPNGAGKTTTIKMLTGILWPTSGTAVSNGFVPWKERSKYLYDVGVVFGQKKSFWPELSVNDNIELFGSMYKLTVPQIKNRLEELSKSIDVTAFGNQPFRKLSLGQQMKAELIGALLHSPKILLLDEPTIGMDVVAKSDFIRLLKELNNHEKTTIILTSHDLREIELLCERIIIINKGKVLYDGKISAIKPQVVVISYTTKKGSFRKEIEKKKLKDFLSDLDAIDFSVNEIEIEEVIKQFYH